MSANPPPLIGYNFSVDIFPVRSSGVFPSKKGEEEADTSRLSSTESNLVGSLYDSDALTMGLFTGPTGGESVTRIWGTSSSSGSRGDGVSDVEGGGKFLPILCPGGRVGLAECVTNRRNGPTYFLKRYKRIFFVGEEGADGGNLDETAESVERENMSIAVVCEASYPDLHILTVE